MPVFAPASLSESAGVLAGRAWSGPPNARRLTNHLVRVVGNVSAPAFTLEFWDGTEWRAKSIDVWRELVPLGFDRASILDYRPEVVTAQYAASISGGGRVTVDVTLRRGMRVALFQVSHNQSVTLSASPNPTIAMNKTLERQLASSADANGHKLMMGSPRTWSQTPGTGLLYRTAKTLSFYVGLELSGAGAGDTALDLSMQACGWLSVTDGIQRR